MPCGSSGRPSCSSVGNHGLADIGGAFVYYHRLLVKGEDTLVGGLFVSSMTILSTDLRHERPHMGPQILCPGCGFVVSTNYPLVAVTNCS